MSNSQTPFRLAMLGMIEGNGHPYSWSAIVNGFNPEAMRNCPYPVICDYLGAQSAETVGIPGAQVTHIWTDKLEEAHQVAEASLIPNVVERAEDVIGQVDGVIISTDDGDDHVRRAKPFLDAGIPVFVDKPLATNVADLRWFRQCHADGKFLQSSSGMRYAPETQKFLAQAETVGDLRWITSFTCKTWERYGIHALEMLSPILGPGFLSAACANDPAGDVVQVEHSSGVRVTLGAIHDAYGSFGVVHIYGTGGHYTYKPTDTYTAFRGQLLEVVQALKTRSSTVSFSETVELMGVIIAGRRSRDQGGAKVTVNEILAETAPS